jgi:hypothetical protein
VGYVERWVIAGYPVDRKAWPRQENLQNYPVGPWAAAAHHNKAAAAIGAVQLLGEDSEGDPLAR